MMRKIVVFSDGNFAVPVLWSVDQIIQDAASRLVAAKETTDEELKTHPWRLYRVRQNKKEELIGVLDPSNGKHKGGKRDKKFLKWDISAAVAWEKGILPINSGIPEAKQALRDLPTRVDADLAKIENTDDIEAYLPLELED